MHAYLQKLGIRLFLIAIWSLFLLLCARGGLPETAMSAAYAIVSAMGAICVCLALLEMWDEFRGSSGSEPPNS